MTEPILPARAGRHAGRLALAVIVLAVIALASMPIAASARDEAWSGRFETMLSGWDAFTGMMARGWSDVRSAVEALPTPDLPAPAAFLTTHVVCAGSDGVSTGDCSAAVGAVCRQHGFGSGRQLDIASGRVCRLASDGLARTDHAIACKRRIWLTQVACW